MALGGVAAGNLGAYLPLLLRHVHAQAQSPKQQYQLLKVGGWVGWRGALAGRCGPLFHPGAECGDKPLRMPSTHPCATHPCATHPPTRSPSPLPAPLQALNEVITTIAHGGTAAGGSAMTDAQQAEVLQLLLGAAGESEEECRAVVAECLGSLALLSGGKVLPSLQAQLASPSGGSWWLVECICGRAAVGVENSAPCLLLGTPAACLRFQGKPAWERSQHSLRPPAAAALSSSSHHPPHLPPCCRRGAHDGGGGGAPHLFGYPAPDRPAAAHGAGRLSAAHRRRGQVSGRVGGEDRLQVLC